MSELPLTLVQIAANIPGARRLSPSTITRWILQGCPIRDGSRRVKLAATRCGHRWLVYQTDLDAFFAALRGDMASEAPERTPAARNHASEAASKQLEKMGA